MKPPMKAEGLTLVIPCNQFSSTFVATVEFGQALSASGFLTDDKSNYRIEYSDALKMTKRLALCYNALRHMDDEQIEEMAKSNERQANSGSTA